MGIGHGLIRISQDVFIALGWNSTRFLSVGEKNAVSQETKWRIYFLWTHQGVKNRLTFIFSSHLIIFCWFNVPYLVWLTENEVSAFEHDNTDR